MFYRLLHSITCNIGFRCSINFSFYISLEISLLVLFRSIRFILILCCQRIIGKFFKSSLTRFIATCTTSDFVSVYLSTSVAFCKIIRVKFFLENFKVFFFRRDQYTKWGRGGNQARIDTCASSAVALRVKTLSNYVGRRWDTAYKMVSRL